MSYSARIIQRTDAVRSDGTAALALQVIISRKRKVFPLKIWVKPEEFDKSQPSVSINRGGGEWRKLEDKYNAIMLNNLSKALNILAESRMRHQQLDIDAFVEKFSNGKLDTDFIAFIEASIEKERGLIAESTTKDNEKVLSRLRTYRAELPFSMISVSFLKDFQKHLQKRRLAPNTIAATHKGLRKFIRQAMLDMPGLKNPYENFPIRWADQERTFLEPQELMTFLEAYNAPDQLAGAMRRACRCFLFQCFTGLRVSDAKALTIENVVGEHLVFIAMKTKRTKLQQRIRLNRIARQLIADAEAEYGRKQQRRSLLFFYNDDNVYNRALRDLAAYLCIKKHLSSHVGRHTFASNYLLSGGKVERLMRLMGHSKLETTMIYVHLVEDFLDRDMENYAAAFDLGGMVEK